MRSPPSTNASSAPTTSSRSTPRSSAKWLRVPAGMHAYGSPRSAAIAATIACEPSPPAIASASAPRSTALADERLEVLAAGSSSIGSIPRARASSASVKRSALPPPELRVEEQHRLARRRRARQIHVDGERGTRRRQRHQQPRDDQQIGERRPADDEQHHGAGERQRRRRSAPPRARPRAAARRTRPPRRRPARSRAGPGRAGTRSPPRRRRATIVAAPTTSATIAASRRRISAPHDAREWPELTGPYGLGVIASGRSRLVADVNGEAVNDPHDSQPPSTGWSIELSFQRPGSTVGNR